MKKVFFLILVMVLMFPLGCKSKGTPSASQQEKVPIKAVYLVSQQGGELSQKDLKAHPEVLVVHSGDELKSFVKKNFAAIWVDQNAVNLIERDWFKQIPQKNYPTVLVGSGSLDYSLRLIGGFAPPFVLLPEPMQSGFSVWKILSPVWEDSPRVHSAFLVGYKEPITVENILVKTNPLLENKSPEDCRTSIVREIDKLEDYKIIDIKGLTKGVSELAKYEPEYPKQFSAGLFKVTFQKGNDKKGVILETEAKAGHLAPVTPGKTEVDGYISLMDNVDDENPLHGTKLNKAEEDYFIKMLYKKFQKPMTEEDANYINTVKDYALAVYFNGQSGIDDYQAKLIMISAENRAYLQMKTHFLSLPIYKPTYTSGYQFSHSAPPNIKDAEFQSGNTDYIWYRKGEKYFCIRNNVIGDVGDIHPERIGEISGYPVFVGEKGYVTTWDEKHYGQRYIYGIENWNASLTKEELIKITKSIKRFL